MIAIVFFAAFTALAYSACGSLPPYRDSGDLIATVHCLGIAHPPGYPAYTILTRFLVDVMHWGNAAYRVNLASAVCTAGAGTLLYWMFYRIARDSGSSVWRARAVGLLPASMLLVSPVVFALSRVAEMYAMALLAGTAILALSFQGSLASRAAAAFLLGIGMGIHPTLIFLIPFVALSTFVAYESVSAWRVQARSILLLCLAFGMGVSILAFLPLRAVADPLQNWGEPSTWRQFWRVVTRADYGGLKLHPEQSHFAWSAAGIGRQLVFFLNQLVREWGILVVPAVVGWAAGLRRPEWRRWSLGIVFSFLWAGPGFFLLSNLPLDQPTTPAILQPYLLLPGLLLASGLGLFALRWRSVGALAVLAAMAMPVWSSRAWPPSDRRSFLAYDFARDVAASLPRRAVLFEPDDPTAFSLRALQVTQGRRLDLLPLNFFRTRWGYEQLRRRERDLLPPTDIPNGYELVRQLWGYSAQRRPFYVELPQKLDSRPYRSEGLVYRVFQTPTASTPESRRAAAESMQRWRQRQLSPVVGGDIFFYRQVQNYYASALNNLGVEYANANEAAAAITLYKRALGVDPELSAARSNWNSVQKTVLMSPHAAAADRQSR